MLAHARMPICLVYDLLCICHLLRGGMRCTGDVIIPTDLISVEEEKYKSAVFRAFGSHVIARSSQGMLLDMCIVLVAFKNSQRGHASIASLSSSFEKRSTAICLHHSNLAGITIALYN